MDDNYGVEVDLKPEDGSFIMTDESEEGPRYRTKSPSPAQDVWQSLQIRGTPLIPTWSFSSEPERRASESPPPSSVRGTSEFPMSPTRFTNDDENTEVKLDGDKLNLLPEEKDLYNTDYTKTGRDSPESEESENESYSAKNLSKAEEDLLVPIHMEKNEKSEVLPAINSLTLREENPHKSNSPVDQKSPTLNRNGKTRKSKSRISRSDGKIKVPRAKKIKCQIKARTRRIMINCQKVNLIPYSEIESSPSATHENHCKKLQRIKHLYDFCQTKVSSPGWGRSNSTLSATSVVTHEILRGKWTWATAWSPDGKRLALASENSPLVILDTTSTPVWKIIYNGPFARRNRQFSVRAMAWGDNFIAIGGTGDIVTILDGTDYRLRHTITGTGYVGSLDWKPNSCILAIGTRFDRFHLVRIVAKTTVVSSTVIASIKRDDWVNVVSFSPLGGLIAVGDKKGNASIFNFRESYNKVEFNHITDYLMEDSILFISWSSSGDWLFIGGEDSSVSVVDTRTWNVVNEVCRDLWVFFAACSNTGTHIAVGGASSRVDLFKIGQWNNGTKIELNGNVVLNAKWHPEDKYLSLGGQNGIVKVVDIIKSNDANTKCIRFTSGIQTLDVSPDGKYVAVGKEEGVVSFVDRMAPETSSSIAYEVVVACGLNDNRIAIQWSPNNSYVAVGGGNMVIVFFTSPPKKESSVRHSRFSICTIIRDLDGVKSISFSPNSKLMIVCGATAKVFHVEDNFCCKREFLHGSILCSSWSPDGSFLALIGKDKKLMIFDTQYDSCDRWRTLFDLCCENEITALSWGPTVTGELYYLAFGGEDTKVTVIEIRSIEECWEVVLELPCPGMVLDMHWRRDGMLAVGNSNGSAKVADLTYFFSGAAVNQMDYNWQRQGITSSVLVERKAQNNSVNVVRWLGPNATKGHVLVLGGSDGVVEVVDFSPSIS